MKLEDELREAFARQAEDVSIGAPALQEIQVRGVRRRRARRGAAALAALGVVIALAVPLALLGPLASNPAAHPLAPGEVVRVPVRDPQPLVADDQAVWVAGDSATHGKVVYRIDAQTHEVEELDNTAGANWPAVGEGFAWTTCGSRSCHGPSVLKLDPKTGATLATIGLPGHSLQIATGLGYVWVTTENGIVKIDPASATIVTTFPASANRIGTAGGALWVTEWKSGHRKASFAKLDPDTGQLVARVPMHYPCTFLATEQMVWSATCQPAGIRPNFHDELVGIDPATARIVYRVPSADVAEMVYADGYLWTSGFSANTPTVTQRNPGNGQPTGVTVAAPARHPWISLGLGSPGIFIAAGGGAFWLTHVDADAVVGVGIPDAESSLTSPTVSTGARVTVPDVVGTSLTHARDALNRVGFTRTEVQVVPGTYPTGVVTEQHPAAGVAADPRDTVVALTIGPRHSGPGKNGGGAGASSTAAAAKAAQAAAAQAMQAAPILHGSHPPVPRAVSAACPVVRGVATPSTTSGAPGTSVTVTGSIYHRQQGGRLVIFPKEDFEAWWNLPASAYGSVSNQANAIARGHPVTVDPSAHPTMLGDYRPHGACSIIVRFVVPDVPPGTHPVAIVAANGQGLTTVYGSFDFTVTQG